MSVHEERRDGKSQRIPFEAIVEIGGEVDSSAAFEAQGVDLSASGMQMRTAYLPDVGQALLCRFGSGAHEISASCEVVWRREGSRGGEFGVRFTNLDGASEAALWDMCGINAETNSADAASTSRDEHVHAGTRVRLHIDGLGSPMKARVRGVSGDELLVGSNLEFLRVGRTLELEDVDRGGKRPAHIDRVDVELDRASNVPQLVVTLRYDDVEAGAPVYVRATPSEMSAAASPALGSVDLSPIPPQVAVAPLPSARPTRDPAETDAAHDEDAREAREEIEAAKMMRSKMSAAAADVMPKVAALGARARTTLSLLMARASERATQGGESARRRTTSPPPTGALHATGKRVFREGGDEDPSFGRAKEAVRPPLGKRSMAVFGGCAAMVVVGTAFAFHHAASPPPGETAQIPAAVGSAATPVTAALAADPATGASLQANVPLFGPTTLSTTEPVAPAPVAAAALSPSLLAAAGVPGNGAVAPGSAGDPNAGSSMQPVDDRRADSDESHGGKSRGWVPAFSHGKVTHPNIWRLKTDGTISEMHGTRLSTGFTVNLPGRRALEQGTALAARDPRIASVHVSNGSKGSELAVQFKDAVPSYIVRAKGHDLQIAIGRSEGADDTVVVARPEERDRPTKAARPSHGITATKPSNERRALRDR